MQVYVSFGTDHCHNIQGKEFGFKTLAAIECENESEGIKRAHRAFGRNFCTTYTEANLPECLISSSRFAPLPTDREATFARYGSESNSISIKALAEDIDCVARIEESGSEGYYVEVARWYDSEGWCKIAFGKFFDLDEAKQAESLINQNSAMLPIIHSLPTAPLA